MDILDASKRLPEGALPQPPVNRILDRVPLQVQGLGFNVWGSGFSA